MNTDIVKKKYETPKITHELKLEARAGSCRDDGLRSCDDDKANPLVDPLNLLQR